MNSENNLCQKCQKSIGVNVGLCADCRKSKTTTSEDKWDCGCPKDYYRKTLTEAEDWEVKKKEKMKEILASDKPPYWDCNGKKEENHCRVDYPIPWKNVGTTFLRCPNGCGEIGKKVSQFGDEKELEHTCPQQSQPTTSDLSFLKSYLQTNKIKQISLTNQGELLIEYQNSQTKKTEVNNQQLRQIKSYLQTSSSKVLSMDNLVEREREREREQNQPKSNTILYVSLGIGGLALIGGLVYFFTRKKGEKE